MIFLLFYGIFNDFQAVSRLERPYLEKFLYNFAKFLYAVARFLSNFAKFSYSF